MQNNEREILTIAQEECAEVIQAISKVFRFGYDSVWPEGDVQGNRSKLQSEVGDLLAMIEIMIEKDIVDHDAVIKACSAKKAKLKIWSNIYSDESQQLN